MLTHIVFFKLTDRSLDAMQEYQTHPLHQSLLPYMRESSESIVAVDYES